MLNKFIKAFTLVEMLVALAVSSIIIIASYASYDLVATQYRKNLDIADMHTSGRAIMRIIERDIRMAGFEYRDKDAKVTYGSISSPLTIKDSGNKCCDEVTVIYDYFDEESKKAERIRIRYWAEPHTSNKGSRHRLYKRKDILGQNKKILAKPILGIKDVMADYIEDLQIVNIEKSGDLYVGQKGYSMVQTFDPSTKQEKQPRITTYSYPTALAFGPDGLLYVGQKGYSMVQTFDPSTKQEKQPRITTYSYPTALAFGPDGLLYVGQKGYSMVQTFDPSTKQEKQPRITTYSYPTALAFGPDGLLYVGQKGYSMVQTFDPSTKQEKQPRITTYSYPTALAFGPDGLLYVGQKGYSMVQTFDPSTKQEKQPRITTYSYPTALAFGPDGLLYVGQKGYSMVQTFDPSTKQEKQPRITTYSYPTALAFKNKRTGQESLVTINLTLRTKNQYGKDRQFKKKDYHAGNYKLDKTDKYKRDTFSSTVLVRNLAL